MTTVLLIDNYDSFTHNLAQLLGAQGARVVVARNDAITLGEVEALAPSHVVLSPGPGNPAVPRDFGVCADLVRAARPDRPLLGVCLGHQGIAHHLGGRVVRAPTIMHGKSSPVRHDGRGVFAGLPSPLEAMRYHSLTVERASLPACLVVTAETDDGVIMGLRHVALPLEGLQFHPESIGTPDGGQMMRNFLFGPGAAVAVAS